MTALRFDVFRLDTATRELSKDGVIVALPPRVFACLALLARHRERAMGRDELIEAMWDGRGATDVQLAQLVLQCRRAVDDDGQRQRVIRTVPGFGYRWVAAVREDARDASPAQSAEAREVAEDPPEVQPDTAAPERIVGWRRTVAPFVLFVLAMVAVIGYVFSGRDDAAPVASGGALVAPLVVGDPEMAWLRLGGLDVVVERLRRNRVPVLSSETSVALAQSLDPAVIGAGDGPAWRRLREASGADVVIGLRAVRMDGLWEVEAGIDRDGWPRTTLEVRDDDPIRALRLLADHVSSALGHVTAEPGTAPGHDAVAITLQQARAALLANQPRRARELLLANPALVRDEPLLRQQLAEVDIRAGRYAQARETLDELLAAGDGDALFRAQLLEARGMVAIRGGRFADAGVDFSAALSLLGKDGDALALGRAYLGRGISRTSLQDYTGALADNALAREAFQRSGDMGSIARGDSNTGALEILRGHMAQADAYLQRALARFRDLGFVQERVNALQLAFVAARARLEHAAAGKAIDEVWALRERIISPSSKWSVGLYRVEWLLWNGDLAAAQALLETLAGSARPAAAAEQERLHLLRATLARERGLLEDAWRELEPIPDAVHASADDDSVRAEVTLLRARLARALGRSADEVATGAGAIVPVNPRTPLRLLAEANRHLARGDAGRARQAFEEALALADEQGVPRTLVAVAVDQAGELLAQGHGRGGHRRGAHRAVGRDRFRLRAAATASRARGQRPRGMGRLAGAGTAAGRRARDSRGPGPGAVILKGRVDTGRQRIRIGFACDSNGAAAACPHSRDASRPRRAHQHERKRHMRPNVHCTLRRGSGTRLPAALAGLLFAGTVGAAVPAYHLTRLEIPGAQGIYVNDINDAGEMVGYYIDENFLERAFLWDADGPHDLAVPASANGNDVFSAAAAINNAGQIVGYANVWDEMAPGLLWNSDDPGHYELLSPDPLVALTPSDISDNGTAVGLKAGFQTGEAFHGFVWTAATGVVDYGTTDTANPEINASWIAVNDAGDLVGVWNFQFAAMHASAGVVGTPAMLPLSAASDAVASTASGINAGGQRIGYMDMDGSGNQVPVTFATDGVASAIPGATLGLPAGQALGINDAGTIVGRANDFATLSFKAFVAIDGTSYDLFDHVDDSGGFDYFLAARAVNASGRIVGIARYGDLQVGSFVLTPSSDAIFADGFEP